MDEDLIQELRLRIDELENQLGIANSEKIDLQFELRRVTEDRDALAHQVFYLNTRYAF